MGDRPEVTARRAVACVLTSGLAVVVGGCVATDEAEPPVEQMAGVVESTSASPMGALPVAQYWPGSEGWPPPSPIGPQYWPGTELWPPPSPIGPQVWPWPSASSGPIEDPSATSERRSATTGDEVARARLLGVVGTAEAAYDTAARNPADPALRAAIVAATAPESPAQAEYLSFYDAMVEAGRFAVPRSGVMNSLTVIAGPMLTPSGSGAVVEVCEVSGDLVMRAEGQSQMVVSDAVNARTMLQTFALVDGAWRLYERVLLVEYPGAQSCA